LIVLVSCKKSIIETQQDSENNTTFGNLELFKGMTLPLGAEKQLTMRYGSTKNWLRYVNSFKPRHHYTANGAGRDSSGLWNGIQPLSLYVPYQWYYIDVLDEYGFPIGRTRVRSDRYLLDELEEHGYTLPYSCRSGASSPDAVRLISGQVDQSDQSFLSDNQVAAGFVLLSVAYPLSDCVIKINQEQYLYDVNWEEWNHFTGTSGSGGNQNSQYNNNLTTSTYKGVVYTPADYPGKDANMPWMWWVNSNITAPYYDLWEMMEEERLEEEFELQLDCYGTRRTGGAHFPGTYEHWLIQLDYINRYPGGVREYSIPFAGSSGTHRGYADLANLNSRELFEIKPNNFAGQSAGANEISNYVSLANTHCPVVPAWRKGTNYYATSIRAGNRAILCSLYTPGVIVYRWDNAAPRPIPVASPEVIKKLKELLKLLVLAGESYNYILTTFLQNNPDVVFYIKSAVIGVAAVIVVGTIIEDIMTAGVGIADDWLHFMMAYRLVRFAMAL
jgi:2Fe-2S type ferredoxin